MTVLPDHPFALWTIFRGIHRWFLAPECPPTLRDDRRWVRALRTSVLMGMLGLTSSWMTTLWLCLGRELNTSDIANDTWIFAQGAFFGFCVTMPLSRWIGRTKLLGGLALIVSMGAYYSAALLWLQNPLAAVLTGAGALGLWFIDPRKLKTWWLAPLTALAGLVGLAIFGVIGTRHSSVWPPTLLSRLDDLLQINSLFAPFHTLIAVALGYRLWRDAPVDVGSRFPAAGGEHGDDIDGKSGQED